jgi:ATP:ADP antiporter, AAA family
MRNTGDQPGFIRATVLASTVAIAFQLAAKATRDALFITSFGVTLLPRMVVTAAVLSLLVTLWIARRLAQQGPAKLVPRLFAGSAALLLLEWLLTFGSLRAAAFVVYLHVTALGALLVSAFWALVNESFDPRAARRAVSLITAGASAGGLLGGVLTERMGTAFSASSMLPLLALLHLSAAFLVQPLARASASRPLSPDAGDTTSSAIEALRHSSYLRLLFLLVALAAAAEGVLDYVFKLQASTMTNGPGLLRLFAVFYTVTSLLTILLQVTLLRGVLNQLGVARSTMLLPGGVALGALGGLALPGFPSVSVARGVEMVLRNSVFRSAQELLYSPVSARERRAAKPVVDVGGARLGDIAGAGLAQLAILAMPVGPTPFLLVATLAIALVTLGIARRMQRGYLGALERSLRARENQLGAEEVAAAMFQTVGAIDLTSLRGGTASVPRLPEVESGTPRQVESKVPVSPTQDVAAARSRLRAGALNSDQVDGVIDLLAWDPVASDAVSALRRVASDNMDLLTRRLLDPDEDFAVRRRLVAVLADCFTARSFESLVSALADRRFEVRYRAGGALARMTEKMPGVRVKEDQVMNAIHREVTVERGVWEGRQLLDADDELWSPIEADIVRDRANRSLEHVFTLLSLVRPAAPLRLAYRALLTDDPYLRGTALEYLESVLPESIRVPLWPFLEQTDRPKRPPRPPGDVVQELLASKESIVLALAAVRRRATPAEGNPRN